jgi:hypothetical protein
MCQVAHILVAQWRMLLAFSLSARRFAACQRTVRLPQTACQLVSYGGAVRRSSALGRASAWMPSREALWIRSEQRKAEMLKARAAGPKRADKRRPHGRSVLTSGGRMAGAC